MDADIGMGLIVFGLAALFIVAGFSLRRPRRRWTERDENGGGE